MIVAIETKFINLIENEYVVLILKIYFNLLYSICFLI